MAHFAKLDDNNVVLGVVVVNNDVITVDGVESEKLGIDFLTNLYGHKKWMQTSYNGSFRKNYAGIGYTYDEDLDGFIPPRPYSSWVFDYELENWKAPKPYPVDDEGYIWFWSEYNKEWVKSNTPSEPQS